MSERNVKRVEADALRMLEIASGATTRAARSEIEVANLRARLETAEGAARRSVRIILEADAGERQWPEAAANVRFLLTSALGGIEGAEQAVENVEIASLRARLERAELDLRITSNVLADLRACVEAEQEAELAARSGGRADAETLAATSEALSDALDAAAAIGAGCYRSRLEQAEKERNQLQAFKEFCHAYLDAHGVPHHPPGTHGAEGCRIGDRLDWLLGHAERAETALRELCLWKRADGDCWCNSPGAHSSGCLAARAAMEKSNG